MKISELGVGLIFFPGFEEVLESNSDLINLIEIEPQTLWQKTGLELDSYSFDSAYCAYLKQHEKPIVFHGVGFPIGGTIPPDEKHKSCLHDMMKILKPVWLSEHLSFNRIEFNGVSHNTNFLLPPVQTSESVARISTTIRNYSKDFQIPFAFETGVNYLQSTDHEMQDGAFIQSIAEKSGAFILLDLHNLLANERNGRQSVQDCLRQIDPQHILQIHLAGGFYHDKFYLDAHSSVSSQEVLDLFEEVVITLPALKAVTFEMRPDYLPTTAPSSLRHQFEAMNRVWDKRGTVKMNRSNRMSRQESLSDNPSMKEWEDTLGQQLLGLRVLSTPLANQILEDPGFNLIKKITNEFKTSTLVSTLKLTCRYLILKYGLEGFLQWQHSFWTNTTATLFAFDNGLNFAKYLLNLEELTAQDDVLTNIINYEYASLLSQLEKQPALEMQYAVKDLVQPLLAGKLPKNLPRGRYLVNIDPDPDMGKSFAAVFHD